MNCEMRSLKNQEIQQSTKQFINQNTLFKKNSVKTEMRAAIQQSLEDQVRTSSDDERTITSTHASLQTQAEYWDHAEHKAAR